MEVSRTWLFPRRLGQSQETQDEPNTLQADRSQIYTQGLSWYSQSLHAQLPPYFITSLYLKKFLCICAFINTVNVSSKAGTGARQIGIKREEEIKLSALTTLLLWHKETGSQWNKHRVYCKTKWVGENGEREDRKISWRGRAMKGPNRLNAKVFHRRDIWEKTLGRWGGSMKASAERVWGQTAGVN